MKKIITIIAASLTLLGCERFLDVEPRGVVPKDKQFSDLQGFKDAMFGVYARMGNTKLYGKNLTYGFVDILGQVVKLNQIKQVLGEFNYADAGVKVEIADLWLAMYQNISYLNSIISEIESSSIASPQMQVMRGEAYALRAFMHYDIARLFAQNYQQPNNVRLPYSYHFDLKNRERYSIEDYFQNILKDLDQAQALLEQKPTTAPTSDYKDEYAYPNYGEKRFWFVSLEAVKAIKARVYYSMGDLQNAKKYAQEVVESGAFALYEKTQSTPLQSIVRYPFEKELIFGVSISPTGADDQDRGSSASQEIYRSFMAVTDDNLLLPPSKQTIDRLYGIASFSASNQDWRYDQYYQASSGQFRFKRFAPTENIVVEGLPLIRLPEMYYILAEALYDANDPTPAKEYLDKVRASRGLAAIDVAQIQTQEAFILEMRNERTRELPGEGQIFFALKHYYLPFNNHNGQEIKPSAEVFVLPMPENEIEYGNN